MSRQDQAAEAEISKALSGIEHGRLEYKRIELCHPCDCCGSCHNCIHTPDPVGDFDGKGMIESYSLFCGIEISIHRYLAKRAVFHHEAKGNVLEINHCRRGRIGWDMVNGQSVYLGEGDICLHSMESCAESEITLPLGCYEGIAITADMEKLGKFLPDILSEAGFDAEAVYKKYCLDEPPFGIPANADISGIFQPLYDIPERLRPAYFKLKAQEALIYLIRTEPSAEQRISSYGSGQIEIIKEIHELLVNNPDKRYTIEELAAKYYLSTSSLKAVFKSVYGMPIAAYVKTHRMQLAASLLRETDLSVAEISRRVGYETQGKFTAAFKSATGRTPKEFRR